MALPAQPYQFELRRYCRKPQGEVGRLWRNRSPHPYTVNNMVYKLEDWSGKIEAGRRPLRLRSRRRHPTQQREGVGAFNTTKS